MEGLNVKVKNTFLQCDTLEEDESPRFLRKTRSAGDLLSNDTHATSVRGADPNAVDPLSETLATGTTSAPCDTQTSATRPAEKASEQWSTDDALADQIASSRSWSQGLLRPVWETSDSSNRLFGSKNAAKMSEWSQQKQQRNAAQMFHVQPMGFTPSNVQASSAQVNPPAPEKLPKVQLAREAWTTIMVSNIPNDYCRDAFIAFLVIMGLGSSWNLLYLPIDWVTKANKGYAFVNLVTHAEAERCFRVLNGFRDWTVASEKVVEVKWAQQQGLEQNIESLRNQPMMRDDVPDNFKPVWLKDGQQIAFPPPTKNIKLCRSMATALKKWKPQA